MADTTGLLDALLAVQGEAPTMPKDRTVKVKTKTGGEYTYSYTPLDTIVEKVGPLLHKNGLVWSTLPGRDAHGDPALRYRLAHASTGEVLEGEMPLLLADEDPQSMGSAITYMRRYALCAVLNIVADADDDGALASANGGARTPRAARGVASEKQIAFLASLLKRQKVTKAGVRTLLNGVDYRWQAPDEDVHEAVKRLSGAQASMAIERLKDGPTPAGGSDVPVDASGFEVPPVDEGQVPFFSEGDAA